MTENNTNDRRFWMVIASYQDVLKVCRSEEGKALFVDDKEAQKVAESSCSYEEGIECYLVEAISKYSIPSPRVVKQNLHIPPLQSRDNDGKQNE